MSDDDDARLDATIVELFADKAEGWEFLTVLPDDALAQLRERQCCGKLDKTAMADLAVNLPPSSQQRCRQSDRRRNLSPHIPMRSARPALLDDRAEYASNSSTLDAHVAAG